MAINYKDNIIVYQVGRVGSKAIVNSLLMSGYLKTYHVHHFEVDGRPLTTNSANRDTNSITDPKYITIVKDPVARNLSSFMFDIRRFISSYAWKDGLSNEFKYKYFIKLFRHDYILSWFDIEFKKNVGLDIYKYKFDSKKGYQIIDNVLIIQSERLSKLFPKASKEFLNFPINVKDKERNYIPKYFEIAKYLEESYLNEVYSSKYVKHFYNEEQIKEFKRLWKNL